MKPLSECIKSIAAELGFSYCGIAASRKLEEDARFLESWLSKGFHGSMAYMANHFDMRVDPSLLVPGAKSVITVLMNYFPASSKPNASYKISKYAYGHDYHELIRARLHHFLERIREIAGHFEGRGFVDSAPVLERAWAKESGLGWIGKNGNLITPKDGSFFFIATLITDLQLDHDPLFQLNRCGSCRKCIDACPTGAILKDATIDGSRCVSYFTIELKSLLIPEEFQGKFQDWIFGCDICQDICPWNRFSKPTTEPGFSPLPEIFQLSATEWESLSEDRFKMLFKHSPIKRAKYQGLLRNIKFVQKNASAVD